MTSSYPFSTTPGSGAALWFWTSIRYLPSPRNGTGTNARGLLVHRAEHGATRQEPVRVVLGDPCEGAGGPGSNW
jgi:hypothetical protein